MSLLPLLPLSIYCLAVILRPLQNSALGATENRQSRVVAICLWIFGSAPFLFFATTEAPNRSIFDMSLFSDQRLKWPLAVFHVYNICMSTIIVVWLTFGGGAEFIFRNRGAFMLPSGTNASYVHWKYLLPFYPISYAVALLFLPI
jgi:hypothetical protein